MTQQLEGIFGELGISQYLDIFIDQGFDTWETILDITESDLDALGVKLGHRRKLQRRIANTRGLAPGAALVSPAQTSVEDTRPDAHRPDVAKVDNRETTTVIAKRKYRRHPKPDENAPERPPSAYVLFSNKMREDLKGRNLTFTEIAKLVGENWQNLPQAKKEPFETQAQTAKDKYNQDLAAYKKTPEYKNHTVYLQEFRAKHSGSSQEKDASKRLKLSESDSTGHSSAADGATPTPPRTGSATGSRTDGMVGSEPPPSREQRVGSVVSAADSQYMPSVTPSSHHAMMDDTLGSPTGAHGDRVSEMSPTLSMSPGELPSSQPSRRTSSWLDGQRPEVLGSHRNLPSLSDMFDSRSLVNGTNTTPDGAGYNGFSRAPRQSGSPGPVPSLVSSNSRPPSLRKEYSSTGSTSSSFSFPRTPIEGSLPIHALLLSGKPAAPFESGPIASIHPLSPDSKPSSNQYPSDRFVNDPPANGAAVNGTGTGYFASRPSLSTPPGHYGPNGYPSPQHPARTESSVANGTDAANLDGITALLKAREIVDRQSR